MHIGEESSGKLERNRQDRGLGTNARYSAIRQVKILAPFHAGTGTSAEVSYLFTVII